MIHGEIKGAAIHSELFGSDYCPVEVTLVLSYMSE